MIIPCITFSGPTHLVVILSDFFEKKQQQSMVWAGMCPFSYPENFPPSSYLLGVSSIMECDQFQPLVGWCLRWFYYFKSLHEREPLLAKIPKIANHQHQAATNSWLTNWLLHHFVEPREACHLRFHCETKPDASLWKIKVDTRLTLPETSIAPKNGGFQ